MGSFEPESILNFGRRNLDAAIVCRVCFRQAVYDVAELHQYFIVRQWDTRMPLDVRHFRCACGARDVVLVGVPESIRPKLVLRPLYVTRADPQSIRLHLKKR